MSPLRRRREATTTPAKLLHESHRWRGEDVMNSPPARNISHNISLSWACPSIYGVTHNCTTSGFDDCRGPVDGVWKAIRHRLDIIVLCMARWVPKQKSRLYVCSVEKAGRMCVPLRKMDYRNIRNRTSAGGWEASVLTTFYRCSKSANRRSEFKFPESRPSQQDQ